MSNGSFSFSFTEGIDLPVNSWRLLAKLLAGDVNWPYAWPVTFWPNIWPVNRGGDFKPICRSPQLQFGISAVIRAKYSCNVNSAMRRQSVHVKMAPHF